MLLSAGVERGYWDLPFTKTIHFSGDPVIVTPDSCDLEVTEVRAQTRPSREQPPLGRLLVWRKPAGGDSGAAGEAHLLTWRVCRACVWRTLWAQDDEFLVLSTDGLWDVFEPDRAMQWARKELSKGLTPEQVRLNKGGCNRGGG